MTGRNGSSLGFGLGPARRYPGGLGVAQDLLERIPVDGELAADGTLALAVDQDATANLRPFLHVGEHPGASQHGPVMKGKSTLIVDRMLEGKPRALRFLTDRRSPTRATFFDRRSHTMQGHHRSHRLDQPHPTGLKPTLRQMMIVVLWAALLTAGTRAAIQWRLLGDRPEFACITVPIHSRHLSDAPHGWLTLGARPSRPRPYLVSLRLHDRGDFQGGILFSLQDPVCYYLTGRPTMTFPMGPIIALVGFSCGWMQWQTARPRQCPSCGRNAVIPIAHLVSPRSKRKFNTGKRGWCASCGASCEREGKEGWRLSGRTP